MKNFYITLTTLLCSYSSLLSQQSIWEITPTTVFEVQLNADFCVDTLINAGGNLIFNGTRCGTPVGIITENNEEIPTKFSLYDNYPNPFNPTTIIKFDIPKNAQTSIIIYDVTGREVTKLINRLLKPGRYSVIFDGSNLASGVYIYKILAGDFSQVKKMILVK